MTEITSVPNTTGDQRPSPADLETARHVADAWAQSPVPSLEYRIAEALAARGAEIERLRAALKKIATMKPGPIGDGFQHGPALLLSNCQYAAWRALRKQKPSITSGEPTQSQEKLVP